MPLSTIFQLNHIPVAILQIWTKSQHCTCGFHACCNMLTKMSQETKISLMHNKNCVSKRRYPGRKFVQVQKKLTTNICNAIRKYFYGFTKTWTFYAPFNILFSIKKNIIKTLIHTNFEFLITTKIKRNM